VGRGSGYQVYSGGAWSVAMIAVLGIFLVLTSSGTKSIT
jgi:ABC-type phosphate transport system auxiliary subunit